MTTDKSSTAGSSLHRKIAEIVAEISGINKTGTAPDVMGGYAFVEGSRVLAVIRAALAKRNMTMLLTYLEAVRTPGGTEAKPNVTVDLTGTFEITDADTGESITVMSFGAGKDSGDKYSGKAMASMTKYAVLTAFLLPTGPDVESYPDVEAEGTATTEPKPRATRARKASPEAVAEMTQPVLALASDEKKNLVWARSHEVGLDEQQFKALSKMLTAKEHSAEWTTGDVDKIVNALGTPMVDLFKGAKFPETVPA